LLISQAERPRACCYLHQPSHLAANTPICPHPTPLRKFKLPSINM
jgi:hypothetical protein